jgi:putative ABC transport system permease protein
VRKALGAKKRDILWQFLTEAMTLTGTCGLIGIALGGGVAWLRQQVLAVPGSCADELGARRLCHCPRSGTLLRALAGGQAARLDPIEALRYE